MRRLFSILLLSVLAAYAPAATAQAVYTASRTPVQVGGGFSFASPDYGDDTYVKGFTVFADAAISRRFTAEADVHYDSILTPRDIGENTFLLGPRYSFALEDRANLYVKALGGLGRFEYQPGFNLNPHAENCAVFAPGAGIEFQVSHRINIRAIDVEYQVWPGFSPHGLSPFVTTMGAGYRF